MVRFRSEVQSIVPYVPGKPIEEVARELGLSDIAKLASNEYPLPPFPEVQQVVAAAASDLNRYPDNDCFYLRQSVAEHLGVPEDYLWFGDGSVELLTCAALAVGGSGTTAVYAWPSFVMYRIASTLAGTRPIEVPTDADFRHDVDAMIDAVRDDTTAVYVCNPNNPTGTHISRSEVERLVDAVGEDVLVVVDEAYHEFVTASDYGTMVPLTVDRPNVMVTRTFSKVYGLAGLRLGYAVLHPDTQRDMRKPQAPFSVNSLAQVAAIEALNYPSRVAERAEANAEAVELFLKELNARDVPTADSQTNFVFARLGEDETTASTALLQEGVIVRPMSGGWVRITIGTPEENARFFEAFDIISG